MHVRNSEVRTYDLLRKSVLRSFRMRKARLDVSPKPREARADQERLRRPPGRSPRGRRLGKSTPSHQPGALGSFLGVKAKPLRGRGKPRALTPIPPTVPLKPLRGPLARFSVKGGSRGWCGPQPRRGRTRPLDATGATQACRQGVGGALPPAPLPLGEGPGRVAGRRYKACGAGGTPWGVQGARSLGPANKKPSAEGEHFPALRASLLALQAAPKGPDLQIQKGERRKLDLARVCED